MRDEITPDPIVRSFSPPGRARYELLDQILIHGAVTADRDSSRLQELHEAGLVYRLFAPASTYAITEWGRIVWRQEKVRVERTAA